MLQYRKIPKNSSPFGHKWREFYFDWNSGNWKKYRTYPDISSRISLLVTCIMADPEELLPSPNSPCSGSPLSSSWLSWGWQFTCSCHRYQRLRSHGQWFTTWRGGLLLLQSAHRFSVILAAGLCCVLFWRLIKKSYPFGRGPWLQWPPLAWGW